MALVLHPAARAVDVTLQPTRIEHFLFAVRQCHKHLRLRLAVHRAVAANGARLAAFLAVNNVALGRAVKAAGHQLLFHHILNQLNLQRLVLGQPNEATLHHFVREQLRVRLHRFRRGLVLFQTGIRLQRRLEGQVNSRFIKLNDASIALAHLELFAGEGIQSGHPQLAVELLINNHSYYILSFSGRHAALASGVGKQGFAGPG